MIDPLDKARLTKERYPTVKELRRAVLQGEYIQDTAFFSRPFLWRTICSNTYNVTFRKDELVKVPNNTDGESDITEIVHSKETLERSSTEYDPLSMDEALDVIKLDVDRLLIDPLFQEDSVKEEIIEILYNYNKFTPYKQGFHEICGIIYLQLHNESPNSDTVKVDTFNIFTSMMITVVPNFYNSDNLVGWCVSVFNKYLRLIDPPLYNLLIRTHKVESQVWLIRWVRLVFLRELGADNTMKLWDFMLCYNHDLCKLIPFIIIVLLIKLKLRLVDCEDSGEVLYLLLHYPHSELSSETVKQIVDWSIKLCDCPEDKLETLGLTLNKKIHKGMKWDKIRDLDRLKLELKLQRRVRCALKK
jgi:TBC1 domain family protein 5